MEEDLVHLNQIIKMLDINIDLIETTIQGLKFFKKLGEVDSSLSVPLKILSPIVAKKEVGCVYEAWVSEIVPNLFIHTITGVYKYEIENGAEVIDIISKFDSGLLDYHYEMLSINCNGEDIGDDDIFDYFSSLRLVRMDISSSLINHYHNEGQIFSEYIPEIIQFYFQLEQETLLGCNVNPDTAAFSVWYFENKDGEFAEHRVDSGMNEAFLDVIKKEVALNN